MDPEKITILEGPTPEFRPNIQLWNWSIYEGIEPSEVGFCELRTRNGADIQERCRRAWQEGRPVLLDYPDAMRMRQTIPVVALRLSEVEEGTLLNLWVYQPLEQNEPVPGDDDDEIPF